MKLSEKDKIKFNLLEGNKTIKLNSNTILDNKKKQLRKNLMINSQVNPLLEPKEANKTNRHYNEVKSTIKINFENKNFANCDLSPKNKFKQVEYSTGNTIKLDKNKSKLKSGKILKQVSNNLNNLDESTTNTLTLYNSIAFNSCQNKARNKSSKDWLANSQSSFNTNLNIVPSSPKEKLRNLKSQSHFSTNSSKLIKNTINSASYNLPSECKTTLNKSIPKVSSFNYLKDEIDTNIQNLHLLLSSTNQKKFKTLDQNEELIAERKISLLDDVQIGQKADLKNTHKIISNGINFSSKTNRALKSNIFKSRHSDMNTTQEFNLTSNDFTMVSSGIQKRNTAVCFKKSENNNNNSDKKHQRKTERKASSQLALAEQEALVWPYYVDKYLRFLFTGKVLKYKEALVCKENNMKNNIIGYSCNTNKGIMRNYNEDRVVCLLNIEQPHNKHIDVNEIWPSISYFAIFDGHGGNIVSDWLSENLHFYIINQSSFPKDVKSAILQGFKDAEENLLIRLMNGNINNLTLNKQGSSTKRGSISSISSQDKKHDSSGSCAIITMIVNTQCYVINLGDSRALISTNEMNEVYILTRDHKPDEFQEKLRIESNGGKLWKQDRQNSGCPVRVIPGGLSVS